MAAINALAAARKIVPRGRDGSRQDRPLTGKLSRAQLKRLQVRYGARVLWAAAGLERALAPAAGAQS